MPYRERVDYSVHALPAILLKQGVTFSASAIINGQPHQQLRAESKKVFRGIYHGNHGDVLYLQIFR